MDGDDLDGVVRIDVIEWRASLSARHITGEAADMICVQRAAYIPH